MGRAARLEAEATHTWEHTAALLEETLAQVLRERAS